MSLWILIRSFNQLRSGRGMGKKIKDDDYSKKKRNDVFVDTHSDHPIN